MFRPSVTDLIVKTLEDHGVREVFGIPGDAINVLVDSIRRQDAVRFVQVRHEEAGAFAASAQAKLGKRLAVCTGTAGPGAIHLLNGLYDAKLDGAPVLALTGQVAEDELGSDAQMEVDLLRLFDDVAVFNERLTDPGQMPALIERACRAAETRRGVAHVNLPVDVASQPVSRPERNRPARPAPPVVHPPDDALLDEAALALREADKVAILAGAGALGARDELLDVAGKLGAPILKSLKAKALIPDDHPHCVGELGVLGTRPAAWAADACDLLLMVGTDFPYPGYLPRDARAIQIDIDREQLGKRRPVDWGLHADARTALGELSARLQRKDDRAFLEAAQKRMRRWRAELDRAADGGDGPIRPQRLARAVSDLADDDAVFTCDTGTVTAWTARHVRLDDRRAFTLSGNLESMAYALPAAIGAQLRFPDRQVVALCGDGGFSMLMPELLTAVRYHLPVKVVVFNNRALGLTRIEQEAEGLPEFGTHLQDMDFAAFARVAGARGSRVEDPAALRDGVAEALAADGPYVLDVRVDGEARTLPPRAGAREAAGYGLARLKELFASPG